MYKWTTGSELKKGDVFAASMDNGVATVIKVLQIKGTKIAVEVFDLESKWQKVDGYVEFSDFADMPFLLVK